MSEQRKITLNINGEKLNIDLPKELKLRNQSKECNAQGHLCGLFRNQPCCLKVNIEDDNGQLSIFEMVNCSKNPEQRGLKI